MHLLTARVSELSVGRVRLDQVSDARIEREPDTHPAILSHIIYQLNGFRKSNPKQNCQLMFIMTNENNALTALWGS